MSHKPEQPREIPDLAPAALLPSHRRGGKAANFGWAGSTAVAALLVSAIGALALSLQEGGTSLGESPVPILMMSADVPSIEAMREPSPDVVDQAAQEEVEAPDVEEAPDAPELADAPDVPDVTPELTQDLAEAEPEVDSAVPAPVVEKPKPKKPKAERKKEKPVEQAETKPKKKKKRSESRAETKAGKSTASAASSGGGSKAVADYSAKVMNKVNRVTKKKAGDKGKARVAFKVGDSGALASVSIAASSGSEKLDQVALDHVRRAAPFPPPPPGAKRSFTFTFVGR